MSSAHMQNSRRSRPLSVQYLYYGSTFKLSITKRSATLLAAEVDVPTGHSTW